MSGSADPAGPVGPVGPTLEEFERGEADGRYPRPTAGPVDGVTVTTGLSPWLGIRCRTCNQTFRRGDAVRVTDSGAGVQHLDPRLNCAVPASEHPDESAAGQDALEFAAGLLQEWPPVNGAPVVTLSAGDWQVTRRTSGPSSPVCLGCGHTFRAGDAVIICPCAVAPDDYRREICGLAVHRDPAGGLACWDDWRPDGRLTRCPRTHEKLPD